MKIRVGYELMYDCPKKTPMVLLVNIHHTRANDIIVPDRMITDPFVPMTSYRTVLATGAPVFLRRQVGCDCRPVPC
jgi:hypothetical protein